MKLKDLTETFVKKFADSVIYDRGYDYYESGMVYDLEYDPHSDSILAQVSGNYGDYEVEITSDQDDINAECTCPYDGYPCKHIVAVLLTFIHNQKEYVQQASKHKKEAVSLKDEVTALSKDELVEIVQSCAEKYPDFKRDLMVRLGTDKKATLAAIFKQINKAFLAIESSNYSPSSIVKQLKLILTSVETASEDMRVKVYWKVVDRTLNELNEYGMNEESLEDVALSTMDLLAESLADQESLRGEKATIVGALMDYYTWGNCGIRDCIYDAAIDLCSEKSDYLIVIKKLEAHLQKATYKSYYQNLLSKLYESIGDTESQLKTLESGLHNGMDYWRLAQYWIKHRNKEKALQIVQEGLEKGEGRKNELYLFLQQYYEKRNDYDQILRLLKTKIEKNDPDSPGDFKHDATYNCLWKHYKSKNNYQGQVKLLELHLTHHNIDLDLYQTAEKTMKPEDWAVFEQKIIEQLEKAIRKQKSTRNWWFASSIREVKILAEIYNYKNDMAKLLETVQDDNQLLVEYEAKLLPLYPDVYLKKYCNMIEKLISARGRDNYKTAAIYARTVKKIYQKILKKPAEWNRYISKLRSENKKLPAMQEKFKSL